MAGDQFGKDQQMANNDKKFSNDPYEQKYREQLEEYKRLAGGDISPAASNLQMHGMDEAFANEAYPNNAYHDGRQGYSQYSQYSREGCAYSEMNGYNGYDNGMDDAPSGRTSGAKKRRRPPAANLQYDRDQLHFGSNTPPSQKTPQKKNKPRRKGSESESQRRTREEYEEHSRREAKTKKRRGPISAFFRTIFTLFIIVFLVLNVFILRYVFSVKIKPDRSRAYSSASMKSSSVTNILLIGSDTRSEEEYGRTDTMILLSVNSQKKQVTMTSFMRDMYVNIFGIDNNGNSVDMWDKLNSAYVRGGPELLMDTIEYNFDIAVDDYVYVDFFSFVDIVDSIGGVELTVTAEEAYGMQPPMAEQNKILGKQKGSDYLYDGGTYNMNGNQALAYARLRYVGNADFQRTERQREVISKIIDKVKHSDPLTIDRFMKTTLGDLTTNMSRTDMYVKSYLAMFSLGYEMKSLRLPAEGDYSYGQHGGQSTLDIDINACRELFRKEIYG